MIYFWFPGFLPNSQDIDITKVEVPWNDYESDVTTVRDRIMLRNPNWVTDTTKRQNIIVKRAMNDTVRTVITNDRRYMDLRLCTLAFSDLRKERRIALEHFILCAEGQYIGYKDPYGKCHIILLGANDIPLTQQGRAGGGVIEKPGPTLQTIEDEIATVDITVVIVRTYDQITIDG
jgi:hypothetical protein